MGRDLGRAALMRGRARSVAALLVTALLGAALLTAVVPGLGVGAAAADPTPAPTPTPSVSPPSQQQIDDARAALDRLRHQDTGHQSTGHQSTGHQDTGHPDTGHPDTGPSTQLSQVAGPTTESRRSGVTSRISDQAWWTIGAGLLVLLVASETTRLSVRRAKHRKGVTGPGRHR